MRFTKIRTLTDFVVVRRPTKGRGVRTPSTTILTHAQSRETLKMAAFVDMDEEVDRRVFRDRGHPLEVLKDKEVVEQYRLSRHMIFQLLDDIQDDIQRPTKWSHALPPLTKYIPYQSY